MIRGFIAGLAMLLLPAPAIAADLWVDGDAAPCDGDGSVEAPFCDIDSATAAARPGDTVHVRSAAQPYGEVILSEVLVSGTAAAPIRLVAAPGESPILSGEIRVTNLSYWVVEGFTIVGSVDRGIEVRSPTTPSTGVVIRNNRIFDSSARGIKSGVPDLDSALTNGTIIENNYIFGATTAGIEVSEGSGIIVRGNVVEDTRCPLEGFSPQHGIVVNGTATDVEISGNIVRLNAGCPEDQNQVVGVNIRGASDGRASNNLVEVTGSASALFVGGISLRNDATNWRITDNIIRNSQGCGLCDGADATGASGTYWAHNTVVNTEVGIAANMSTGAVFESNLIVATTAAVTLGEELGVITSRNNILFAPGPTPFETTSGSAVDFADWSSDCGCDEGSQFVEPTLAPDGLTPLEAPALDGAATSMRSATTGTAADIGALEAPIFRDAEIRDDGRRVTAFFEVAHPPLTPAGCEGVQVLRDGETVGLDDCDFGEDTMTISLLAPLYADEDAEFAVLRLFDQAAVGGIGAMVAPIRMRLDTSGLPEAPEAVEEEGEDETDGPGANTPPAEAGCGCRSSTPGSWAFFVIVLALRTKRSFRRD